MPASPLSDLLKKTLSYNADTGIFTWEKMTGKRCPAGTKAGNMNDQRYIIIQVEGVRYRAHRLAWLFYYGKWPDKQIDHINGDRSDNRICNLREATYHENAQNKLTPRNNTSGMIGVCWHKPRSKWIARITTQGETVFLGTFDNFEDAKNAYVEDKSRFHKFHPEVRT